MRELELKEEERIRLRYVPYPDPQDNENPQYTEQDLGRTCQWATQQREFLDDRNSQYEEEAEDQEEYFPYPEENWQEKRARLRDELRRFDSQRPRNNRNIPLKAVRR